MPLPTWLYSQLYSDAWSYQPNAAEIVSQITQTILAGGKGITLFQSKQDDFNQHDLKPIAQILNSIQEQSERTIIMISHQLSAAAACDRILVMDNGQIVQEGSHSELIQNPGLYRKLWEREQAVNNLDSVNN